MRSHKILYVKENQKNILTSELLISEVRSHICHPKKHRISFGLVILRHKMSKIKEMTNDN